MKTRIGTWTWSALAAGALLAACAGAAMALDPPEKDKPKAKETPAADTKDVLILKTGSRVEGEILEETETSVRFKLVAAGGISAERSYSRSEILAIERDVPVARTEPVKAPVFSEKKSGKKKGDTGVGDDSAATVYMIPITGEYGRDCNMTPMQRVMEDARKQEPDVIVLKVDCEFKHYGREKADFEPDLGSFDQLELVRQMAVLITDNIELNPEWKKKPRVVCWLKKALGGVAFLPFACTEIYYTSDALHGGIGYLDFLFDGVGDEVVREKQRSLRLGRALGVAAKGGYDERVIKAMARMDYVLSVTLEGGELVFHEDESGEVPLTDDGDKEAGRRDTFEDVVRYRGNDVLNLNSEMAGRLGVSKGTVDRVEDLMQALEISRNYRILDAKGESILTEWSKGVSDAEFEIRRLRREFDGVRVKAPGGWNERTAARGQRKSILKEMLAQLQKYGESINPYEIQILPADLEAQIRLQIDEIEQEQRRDKK